MNREIDLAKIEAELSKRLSYPYVWGRKQNDSDDFKTSFIYNVVSFSLLLSEINLRFEKETPQAKEHLQNYTLNRWFNFWSAQAIEKIFCETDYIKPNLDKKNRLIDFSIKGINFDHKTSVFPKGFGKSYTYAIEHKRELIEWLYNNQSQGQRKHLRNRLFLVVYNLSSSEHWKLKARISWLKNIVKSYAENFNKNNLHAFDFDTTQKTYSDIIWAVYDSRTQ